MLKKLSMLVSCFTRLHHKKNNEKHLPVSFTLALKQILLIRLFTDADFAVYIALLMGSLAAPADGSISTQVGFI